MPRLTRGPVYGGTHGLFASSFDFGMEPIYSSSVQQACFRPPFWNEKPLEEFMSKMRLTHWMAGWAFAGLIGVPVGNLLFQAARAAGAQAPPVKMTKDEDHKRTMDALHIAELRKGKAGRDKTDPNFANYDESK